MTDQAISHWLVHKSPWSLIQYSVRSTKCMTDEVCMTDQHACVCLAYTSEDFHMKTHRYTEDSTPSEDPKTGPRKTLAKNAKNVMFYHLRGVRAPRTSTDFQPYLIYEDMQVLGSISKASGCVVTLICMSHERRYMSECQRQCGLPMIHCYTS